MFRLIWLQWVMVLLVDWYGSIWGRGRTEHLLIDWCLWLVGGEYYPLVRLPDITSFGSEFGLPFSAGRKIIDEQVGWGTWLDISQSGQKQKRDIITLWTSRQEINQNILLHCSHIFCGLTYILLCYLSYDKSLGALLKCHDIGCIGNQCEEKLVRCQHPIFQ